MWDFRLIGFNQLPDCLKQRIQIEETLARISTKFASPEDLYDAINYSLEQISKLCDSSYTYIFLFDNVIKKICQVFEWSEPALASRRLCANLVSSNLSWFTEQLKSARGVIALKVSDLPPSAETEKLIFRDTSVNSIVALELALGNELHGYALFCNIKTFDLWAFQNIGVLRIFSEIVASAIAKSRSVDALRTSEERFADISANINEWIWEVNRNGCYTYSNASVEQVLGYNPKEIIGKHFFDFFLPEEKDVLKQQAMEVFSRKLPFNNFINKNIRKDGSIVFLETSGTPIFDASGQLVGYRGADRNITERIKAEQRLREAKERYCALFDQAPLGVLLVDPVTTKIVDFNRRAYEQLGYSKEEFAHLCIADIEANETPEDVRVHTNAMLNQGGGEFETKHKSKDGTIRNVLVTTKTIELSDKIFLHVIFHDITEIRQVQDALVVSEASYRRLVELAQEGIWAVDKSYTTTFVNTAMAKMLGYSESEMLGESIFEFIEKDHVQEAKKLLEQFEKLNGSLFEYNFPRKDGTRVFTRISASHVTDDNGESIGVLALVSDITESKQAEEALKLSEERSRTIVEYSPIGIATSNREKRFLSANRAFCEILGYSEQELTHLSFNNITHPDDLSESIERIKALEAGIISSFELQKRYIRKNGRIIIGKLSLSALRSKDGTPTLFIAELEDITERVNKEAELLSGRNKLEAMTQSIGAGFVVISKDYRVQWANKFIREYKGQIEGKLCYATLNDLDHICPGCGVKKVFEDHVSSDAHEYCSTDVNGNKYWVELIATPIKDDKGQVVSAIEVAVDITEKKDLQSKLARYSRKLEKLVAERTKQLVETQARLIKSERLAAIGELAGMIGHDLRNPLTGIKNAMYYLEKKGNKISEEKAKELYNIVNRCIEHSNKIINDLLEYSRDIHLELADVEPIRLLKESLAVINKPDKIELQVDVPNEPKICVDIVKIERVFSNLIRNAIDAMPNGGKLTISGRRINGNMELSFSDTGTGINPECLPKLFLPLFTTKAQGMGFGLAICKRVIEAHGGKIKVDTTVGEGTTFTIIIPVNPNPKKQEYEDTWITAVPESLPFALT